MNREITVTCPYCGTSNAMSLTSEYGETSVVTCDVMEGGCDRYFVVKTDVCITAKSLKIEGEER